MGGRQIPGMVDEEQEVIRLYTAPGCGPCVATKRALNSRGIRFEEVDATSEEARAELGALGYRQVPVTVLPDGSHWHGLDMERVAGIIQEEEEED